MTVTVAGSGAYVLARVLRVGALGCAAAGTIYELSGSFMGWLGWPHAAVMSWAGWILAMAILIVRGDHRVRNVVGLAVFLALAAYSGQPEILTTLLVSVVVFFTSMLVMRVVGEQRLRSGVRPLVDFVSAVAAGIALSSPLLLPGVQVLARSTRNSEALLASTEAGKSLPPHDLIHLLVQGYNGLPIAGNQVFGDAVYFDTAAYLGIIAIALAVVGVLRGWHRREVLAVMILTILSVVIIFTPPFDAVVLHVPLVQTIDWHRDLMVLSLCVAVLAGLGMDALVRSSTERSLQILLGSMFAAGLAFIVVLWLVGAPGFPPLDASLRRDSLKVPLITTALALVAVGVLVAWTSRGKASPSSSPEELSDANSPTQALGGAKARSRRSVALPGIGQGIAGILLLLETVFLVASGAQLWSSSGQGVPTSPAASALLRTIGNSTVGFGSFTCYDGPAVTALGILPEANSLYGIHEFDFYDPVLPRAYLQSWGEVSSSRAGVPIYNSFCPVLTTAEQARRFGVGYVLELAGHSGPTGAIFVRSIGNEALYRIPGSAPATLMPLASGDRFPPDDALGTPVNVVHPSPSSWKITTTGDHMQVLRLRLTDEPGWHATIDGRPLALVPYADVMLQARIPPGNHTIELHYWPVMFTVGLLIAGVCAVLLLTASAVAFVDRRKSSAGTSTT